ncbi:MAG: hypothetical protein FWF88_01425 [Peptococcaceae bacterium]|nr:hypothetical protein [Peptococcaceae bacterium]
MDNGQWTMDKADILQPLDQWTIDNRQSLSNYSNISNPGVRCQANSWIANHP